MKKKFNNDEQLELMKNSLEIGAAIHKMIPILKKHSLLLEDIRAVAKAMQSFSRKMQDYE